MQDVRIVLVGDSGVGKSSLIATLLSESFQTDVPKVVEQVTIAASSTPERVTTHIIDTSVDSPALRTQIMSASVVCIVYDATQVLEPVWKWLQTIHEAKAAVPVVLVASKIDLRHGSKANKALSRQVRPFMTQFKQVESCIECSAKHQLNVQEVFYFAQKAVLHPMAPLFDSELANLSKECERALGRIFTLWDSDRDGILSDDDLKAFQLHCFASALQANEIVRVRQSIAAADSSSVTPNGFTLQGFLRLFLKFLQQGKTELVWTVLRKFGYSDSFALRMPESNLAKSKESAVQLSSVGEAFLRNLFALHDKDRDGFLSATEAAEMFAFVPDRSRPWADYKGVECNTLGWPSLSGFMARWHMFALQSGDDALDVLVWLGADVDSVADLVELVPRSAWDARKLLPFALVGADGVGKSALLSALTGRYRDAASAGAASKDAGLGGLEVAFALPASGAAKGRYALVRELADSGPATADLAAYYAVALAFDPAAPASYDVAISFYEALERLRKPVLFLATKTDVNVLDPAHRVHARLADLGIMPAVELFVLSQSQVSASHVREQKETIDGLHKAMASLAAEPNLGLARRGSQTVGTWRRAVQGGIALSMLAAMAVTGLAVMRKYRK